MNKRINELSFISLKIYPSSHVSQTKTIIIMVIISWVAEEIERPSVYKKPPKYPLGPLVAEPFRTNRRRGKRREYLVP